MLILTESVVNFTFQESASTSSTGTTSTSTGMRTTGTDIDTCTDSNSRRNTRSVAKWKPKLAENSDIHHLVKTTYNECILM